MEAADRRAWGPRGPGGQETRGAGRRGVRAERRASDPGSFRSLARRRPSADSWRSCTALHPLSNPASP